MSTTWANSLRRDNHGGDNGARHKDDGSRDYRLSGVSSATSASAPSSSERTSGGALHHIHGYTSTSHTLASPPFSYNLHSNRYTMSSDKTTVIASGKITTTGANKSTAHITNRNRTGPSAGYPSAASKRSRRSPIASPTTVHNAKGAFGPAIHLSVSSP